MHETVITPDGVARLREKLERLRTDGRSEIAQRLAQAAASEANSRESLDYLGAREEQELLERRIALLEERLASAQVVEPRLGNGSIDLGERVLLHDLESGEPLEIELVGPLEADLLARRISVAAPLGKAILGLRRGDVAVVEAPSGTLLFEVLAVEPTASSRAG